MTTDPVTSLAPCEIDVRIGGELYTVPAIPALDWVMAIIGGTGDIIPGLLLPEHRRAVMERFVAGDVSIEELNRAWRDVLAVACGRSWWSAWRLCASATAPEVWPAVHGQLLTKGIDLERLSIGGLCNVLFYLMVHGAGSPEEVERVKFELEVPPPDERAQHHELTRASAADDFLANLEQVKKL